MSEENHQAPASDVEVSLSMYEQLREEVRAHGKRKSRRYISSLTILGVIIGYIFTTNGDARVLTLVPFVLAFLYLSHISSMNYVVQMAGLLALIEAKLDAPGAEYEYYHGGFKVAGDSRFENLDAIDHDPNELQDVQGYVRILMNLLAVIAYFGAAGLGTLFLSTEGIQAVGIGPASLSSPGLALYMGIALFVVQTALFCLIFVAWRRYKSNEQLLNEAVQESITTDLTGGVRTLEGIDSATDTE